MRWKEIAKETDLDKVNVYKEIQSKLNNMHVVEYDSDYINSGDEDTK